MRTRLLNGAYCNEVNGTHAPRRTAAEQPFDRVLSSSLLRVFACARRTISLQIVSSRSFRIDERQAKLFQCAKLGEPMQVADNGE